ncbi:methyltransferase domain-containing protein, partial [Candidatus Woesearchaeota archaeon]|nr:methyltransferase domain-containing protein [Candidatus Woesearchaeota archaeon]
MKHIFDKIYVKRGKGPWTLEEPPKEIVEVVSKVKPCKALDIGCGEGFFSIYLAKQGFDVTGIDYSEVAVERAKENA